MGQPPVKEFCHDVHAAGLNRRSLAAGIYDAVPELCGTGRLFGRFLKVVDHCSVCGEEFCHHRADDFPAYIVIFVVGHAIVPAALAVEMDYAPPMWLEFLIWLPLMITSALALLQPTKGAIVALQWQLGMHGFEPSKLRRLAILQSPVSDSTVAGNADEHVRAW
jgi:uncharacterized protein (DUF983 family)